MRSLTRWNKLKCLGIKETENITTKWRVTGNFQSMNEPGSRTRMAVIRIKSPVIMRMDLIPISLIRLGLTPCSCGCQLVE